MAAINSVTDYTLDGEVGVITLNSPPVNALSAGVRDGLALGFAAAWADEAAKAIVLICEGRTFIAGGDISEFSGPSTGASVFDLQIEMERANKPIVAAIHGTALGGGLEVALTCHYRVAVPSARCGVPEVNIGLLPGAGGTQRLPRIVGAQKALEMVTSGQHVPATECLAMGLIDALVKEGNLRDGAVAFARSLVAEGRPLKRVRDLSEKVEASRGHPEIFKAFRNANARRFKGFMAPENNIGCIEAAVNEPFDDGMRSEARFFNELMSGSQSRAQQYAFFAERQAAKIPGITPDTAELPIRSVGIVSRWAIAGGVAMAFANAGIAVTMIGDAPNALDRAQAAIANGYAFAVARGASTAAQADARRALIIIGDNLEALASADMVLTGADDPELLQRLSAVCPPDAILALAGAGSQVAVRAKASARPQSVIGLQFRAPAEALRLLEITRTGETSPTVVATAVRLARTLGKIPVVVSGPVMDRMLAVLQREAEALVLDGVFPWEIDQALMDFGFTQGPFAVGDAPGIDAGWIRDLYKAERALTGVVAIARDRAGEIVERCLYPVVNEGAAILEEGLAIRASDIDMMWVHALGWPVYRGGPMWYADHVGLAKVLAAIQERGAPATPAALLGQLTQDKKRLQSA